MGNEFSSSFLFYDESPFVWTVRIMKIQWFSSLPTMSRLDNKACWAGVQLIRRYLKFPRDGIYTSRVQFYDEKQMENFYFSWKILIRFPIETVTLTVRNQAPSLLCKRALFFACIYAIEALGFRCWSASRKQKSEHGSAAYTGIPRLPIEFNIRYLRYETRSRFFSLSIGRAWIFVFPILIETQHRINISSTCLINCEFW